VALKAAYAYAELNRAALEGLVQAMDDARGSPYPDKLAALDEAVKVADAVLAKNPATGRGDQDGQASAVSASGADPSPPHHALEIGRFNPTLCEALAALAAKLTDPYDVATISYAVDEIASRDDSDVAPGVCAMSPDAACKLIEDALRSYRCTYTRIGDPHEEAGLPLVDMLTPPQDGTIKRGEEELALLAEHLFDALPPLAAPATVIQANMVYQRMLAPAPPEAVAATAAGVVIPSGEIGRQVVGRTHQRNDPSATRDCQECYEDGLREGESGAAPLLEALKALVTYTEACEGMLNASPAGQVTKARAVIAEAEAHQRNQVCTTRGDTP
jgi:hypothetical protein